MGCLNFSVHPLFFVFGFFYAINGRISEFVICSVTAIIHELGHSFCAYKKGYRLNKIVLMPFGAVAKGNIEGLKLIDEVAISLAGPLVNAFVAIFFVAIWWCFPDVYAITEVIVQNNIYMALINLIPAYPLDGGRSLNALLSLKMGKDTSLIVTKSIGVAFAIILLCLFVVSIFYTLNISLLLFSMFILFGALSREKENKYVRISMLTDNEKLKRGVRYKSYAVDSKMTLKRLINIVDLDSFVELRVFNNGKEIKRIAPCEVQNILLNGDIYEKIENIIR